MSSVDVDLTDARDRFVKACKARKFPGNIHAVTFQPKLSRINEDRFVVKTWDDIVGGQWLFVAVCDGHGGVDTSEYVTKRLSGKIHESIRSLMKSGRDYARVARVLRRTVKKFDMKMGDALKSLCPNLEELDEERVQTLLGDEKSSAIIRRATYGSTFAAILVDDLRENMWVIGLGDSTTLLTTREPGAIRTGEVAVKLHNSTLPSEYTKIALSHPTAEDTVLLDDRIMGSLNVTRGLGDFPFKLSSEYSKRLFEKVPSTFGNCWRAAVTKYNRTPPYVSTTSEVRRIDLKALADKRPLVVLYTDGVDNIIHWLFREGPYKHNMANTIAALVASPVDAEFMRTALGHDVELRWLGKHGNGAVELLGNIIGGTDASQFVQVLDQNLLTDGDGAESDLYIDDTTIVICPLILFPMISSFLSSGGQRCLYFSIK